MFFIFLPVLALACESSDKDAFARAKKQNTLQSYQAFIQLYPESHLVSEAERGMQHLKDQAREALIAEAQQVWERLIEFNKTLKIGMPQFEVENVLKIMPDKSHLQSQEKLPLEGLIFSSLQTTTINNRQMTILFLVVNGKVIRYHFLEQKLTDIKVDVSKDTTDALLRPSINPNSLPMKTDFWMSGETGKARRIGLPGADK